MDFLEYRPSTIAAAALRYVDDQNFSFFHKNISTVSVNKIDTEFSAERFQFSQYNDNFLACNVERRRWCRNVTTS